MECSSRGIQKVTRAVAYTTFISIVGTANEEAEMKDGRFVKGMELNVFVGRPFSCLYEMEVNRKADVLILYLVYPSNFTVVRLRDVKLDSLFNLIILPNKFEFTTPNMAT